MLNFIYCKVVGIWDHLKYAIAFIIAMFQDIILVGTVMVVIICINQITGVTKALTFGIWHNMGEPFTWKKFNYFYAKVILYNLCILSAHSIEVAIFNNENFWITNGLAGIIAIQELFSSVHNTSILLGNDVSKKFIDFLKSKSNNKSCQ